MPGVWRALQRAADDVLPVSWRCGRMTTYEVVIHGDGGIDREHAGLLRERLLRDGFHEEVVTVREVSDE